MQVSLAILINQYLFIYLLMKLYVKLRSNNFGAVVIRVPSLTTYTSTNHTSYSCTIINVPLTLQFSKKLS